MKLFQTNKLVLSLKNNVSQFLNGLSSNSLDQPQNAFLNVHGRIVATFDQIKIKEDELLLVMEKPFVEEVLLHLERFAKLSNVTIERKEAYKVYFDLEGNYQTKPGEFSIKQKKGQLIITEKNLPSNIVEEEFTIFRLKNNIPLHGVDYKDELLLNVSEEDFVSYTKGCYLGQEPISKVHSRSKPSWKLVVKYENDCTEEEKAKITSKVMDPGKKKYLGFVFVSNQ